MAKFKKIFTLSRIVIIFLLLLYLSTTYTLSKTEPSKSITGVYQSTGYPDNLYEYNFDWEDEETYFLKFNNSLLEKGKFERYEENIYICYDETGNEKIITLLNEGFYFYDYNNKKVVEMVKRSEIPSILIEK